MSLFGAPPSSAPAPAATAGGGLFGAGAAASTPSLFGAPAPLAGAAATGAAPGGGLFGAPAPASAPSAGFGAFGAAASAPATTSLGAFAATGAASAGGTGFGAFGAAAQQPTAGSAFGGFGAGAAAGAAAGTGFGGISSGPAPQQGASAFGFGGAFGQGAQSQAPLPQQPFQQQQQQQQPAQGQSAPQAPPGSTRVGQLPTQAVQLLESAERLLFEQRAKAARLFALQSGAETSISSLRERCAGTRRRLVGVDTGVEALASNASALKLAVREDRRAADGVSYSLGQLSRSLEVENDVGTGGAYGDVFMPVPSVVTHVSSDYFAGVVNDLEERAHAYKREIDQIADFLHADGGNGNGGVSSAIGALQMRYQSAPFPSSAAGLGYEMTAVDGDRPRSTGPVDMGTRRDIAGGTRGISGRRNGESRGQAIEDIIRRQYEYFMVVANSVAGVHEMLTQLKDDYIADGRRHDPDAVDPFSQADARERAEEDRRRRTADAVHAGSLLGPVTEVKTGGPLPGQSAQPAQVGGLQAGATAIGHGSGGFGQNAAAPAGAFASASPGAASTFGSAAPASTIGAGAFGGFGNNTSAGTFADSQGRRPNSSRRTRR